MIRNKRVMWECRGNRLVMGQGNFDNYCVYVERHDGTYFAPTDEWYFDRMSKWVDKEGSYSRFCQVYDMTTDQIDKKVWNTIEVIATSAEEALILGILYLGMYAEENKDGAILKKRIKRLGVHQLLLEGYTAKKAANFSRKQKVEYLTLQCHERGF